MRLPQLFIFFILISGIFSCEKKAGTNLPLDPVVQQQPENRIDTIENDTMSNYYHLDHIAYQVKDSSLVIQMAREDAANDKYLFMLFGLRKILPEHESQEDEIRSRQKKICNKYHIWIFDMGCEGSEIGEIYNREMKRLLKQNEGLDFDEVFNPALATL